MGLIIDCYVNFIEHIGKESSKLILWYSFILSRLSSFKYPDLLLLTFNKRFHPYIWNAVPIWRHKIVKLKFYLEYKRVKSEWFSVWVNIVLRIILSSKRSHNIHYYLNSCNYVYLIRTTTYLHYTPISSKPTHFVLPRHKNSFFRYRTYTTSIRLFNAHPTFLKHQQVIKSL